MSNKYVCDCRIRYGFTSRQTCLPTTNYSLTKRLILEDLLSETRNNAESGDKSDDNSIMPPPLREEEMDAMDSSDELDDDPVSTEMLEDICDYRRASETFQVRWLIYGRRVGGR